MKVYCRFAPMAPCGASDAGPSASGVSTARVPGVPLVLRVSGREPCATGHSSEEVLLVDPITRSHAAFACDGVFVASALESTVVYKGEAVTQKRERDRALFGGDQEALYEHLFAHVSRDGQPPGHRCHLFLTYGQTSSGKTYTLFGPALSSAASFSAAATAASAQPPPTAGVVPRFFHDVFDPSCHPRQSGNDSATVLDLTCMEIYNEVTTDLVALALEKAREARAAVVPPPRRRASQLGRCDSSLAYTGAFPATELSPVEEAFLQSLSYLQETDDAWCQAGALAADGLPAFLTVSYKATEKNKLRRACLRLRCASAAQCWAVTEQLLALRQSSLTERNAHSSRGHLLLRAEVYATHNNAQHNGGSSSGVFDLDREVLFVDLAGSESQRDVGGSSVLPAPPSLSSSSLSTNASGLQSMRHGGNSSNNAYRRSSSGGSVRSLGAESAESSHRRRRGSLSATTNNSFGGGFGSPDSFSLGNAATHGSGLQRDVRYRRSASLTAAALLNPAVEKMRREAATQKRGQELRHINTSLLALRKVIHAFHDASRQQRPPSTLHAPFRDSTLTTVLEPYLIPAVVTPPGQSEEVVRLPNVVFLICCSSQQRDFHETVSSLRLGAEASSVKPTVVLQSLPACRAAPPPPAQAPSSHAAASRSFGRSNSAPVRSASQRSDSQRPSQGSAPPTAPLRPPLTATPAVAPAAASSEAHNAQAAALAREEREELERLRAEVQSYKATAVDLYEQCRQLCDNYARSVKELAASRAAHAEKDDVIAALTAQLEAHKTAAAPVPHVVAAAAPLAPPPPPPTPPPVPSPQVNMALEPPVLAQPPPRRTEESLPREAGQMTTHITDVTPWSVGHDIIISADTTCQKSPTEAWTPQVETTLNEGVVPPEAEVQEEISPSQSPKTDSEAAQAAAVTAAAFRASVLQSLRERQARPPLVETDESQLSDTPADSPASSSAVRNASRVLSATDPNSVAVRYGKVTLHEVPAAAYSTRTDGSQNKVQGCEDGVPRAGPARVFRL